MKARGSKNQALSDARAAKKDEFYTQLVDIANELRHYRDKFHGKVVLCNCDDPYESNFFQYFALNFNELGLKKLVCISFSGSPIVGSQLPLTDLEGLRDEPEKEPYLVEICEVPDLDGSGIIDRSDIERLLKRDKNVCKKLEQEGDFRSQECIDVLKSADIVVTNPPFSLFREFIAQLVKYEKQFLIIGNVNAISYKEIFHLIMDNKIWLGPSIKSGDREFRVPDHYPLNASGYRVDGHGVKYIRVKGVRWFTNIDHKDRHEEIPLYERYSASLYPSYVNYDAIEVEKVKKIPADFDGKMGVPITFLDKYNPDQFEILGSSMMLAQPMSDFASKGTYTQGGPAFYIQKGAGAYNRMYFRIVIRRRQAM